MMDMGESLYDNASYLPVISEGNVFGNLRRDAKRYASYGGWWRNLGFWTVAAYRANVAAHNLRVPILRHLLIILTWMLKLPFHLLFHVELPHKTKIGPGLLMLHPFDVFIGDRVEIGNECAIYHDVTLATYSNAEPLRIGSNVVVFTGARVFGGFSIGESSEIGANCVVTRGMPPHTIVLPPLPRNVPRSLIRGSGGAE